MSRHPSRLECGSLCLREFCGGDRADPGIFDRSAARLKVLADGGAEGYTKGAAHGERQGVAAVFGVLLAPRCLVTEAASTRATTLKTEVRKEAGREGERNGEARASGELQKVRATLEKEEVIIRFAGDSGDGMQVTGSLFTQNAAIVGNDISTLPDFPAEIRAPAGTLAGVSGFQLHLSSADI